MVTAPVKNHDFPPVDHPLHIMDGLLRVQVPFEQIRFPLYEDPGDLCRKFPGVGDTRTRDEEQGFADIRNLSHLDVPFFLPVPRNATEAPASTRGGGIELSTTDMVSGLLGYGRSNRREQGLNTK